MCFHGNQREYGGIPSQNLTFNDKRSAVFLNINGVSLYSYIGMRDINIGVPKDGFMILIDVEENPVFVSICFGEF